MGELEESQRNLEDKGELGGFSGSWEGCQKVGRITEELEGLWMILEGGRGSGKLEGSWEGCKKTGRIMKELEGLWTI